MVGSTPVIPSPNIQKDILMEFVGKEVYVEGKWHPGTEWNPNNNLQSQSSYPISKTEPHTKVRGDGLVLSHLSER